MHKAFFPLFALLETDMAIAGEKVVAQRKLLYLEKLMGSLLVATPRLSDQLDARIVEVHGQLELCGADDGVRFINKSKGRRTAPCRGRPSALVLVALCGRRGRHVNLS